MFHRSGKMARIPVNMKSRRHRLRPTARQLCLISHITHQPFLHLMDIHRVDETPFPNHQPGAFLRAPVIHRAITIIQVEQTVP